MVPVFGEGGALMERKTFDLFYNWPLTLRRRMARRTELRTKQKPRSFPGTGAKMGFEVGGRVCGGG